MHVFADAGALAQRRPIVEQNAQTVRMLAQPEAIGSGRNSLFNRLTVLKPRASLSHWQVTDEDSGRGNWGTWGWSPARAWRKTATMSSASTRTPPKSGLLQRGQDSDLRAGLEEMVRRNRAEKRLTFTELKQRSGKRKSSSSPSARPRAKTAPPILQHVLGVAARHRHGHERLQGHRRQEHRSGRNRREGARR